MSARRPHASASNAARCLLGIAQQNGIAPGAGRTGSRCPETGQTGSRAGASCASSFRSAAVPRRPARSRSRKWTMTESSTLHSMTGPGIVPMVPASVGSGSFTSRGFTFRSSGVAQSFAYSRSRFSGDGRGERDGHRRAAYWGLSRHVINTVRVRAKIPSSTYMFILE